MSISGYSYEDCVQKRVFCCCHRANAAPLPTTLVVVSGGCGGGCGEQWWLQRVYKASWTQEKNLESCWKRKELKFKNSFTKKPSKGEKKARR